MSCCRVSLSSLLLVNELALGFLSPQHVVPLLAVFSQAPLDPVCPVWKCEMWDAAASAMQLSRGKWTRPVILSAAQAKEISSSLSFSLFFLLSLSLSFFLFYSRSAMLCVSHDSVFSFFAPLLITPPLPPTSHLPLDLWQTPRLMKRGGVGRVFA